MLGIDATQIAPLDGKKWKLRIKKNLWPRLYRLADVMVVPSSGGVLLMQSLGIPSQRIVRTAHSVDNAWWVDQASRVNRSEVRARVEHSRVRFGHPVLWKATTLEATPGRPPSIREIWRGTVILSFCRRWSTAYGTRGRGSDVGVSQTECVSSGFVNQSGLPEVYCASDVLVLPSEYEAFGLVVNEAMLCGCPVTVSDRVGARLDLVFDGKTGFIFPVGNLDACALLLRNILNTPDRLQQMSRAAKERMKEWSPEKNVQGLVEAVKRAVSLRKCSRNGCLE